MPGSPTLLRRFVASASLGLSIVPISGMAVPTAVNDTYSALEDNPLVVSNAPLIESDFDGSGGGGAVSFDGDWNYLDQIQNENGSGQSYPLDGSGNVWNSASFDVATSTIGPWSSAAMPLQAGTLDGLQGAPDLLAGIGAAGNGQNLVTTYLFRNTFTLSSAEATVADWTLGILVDDGCVVYVNGVEVDRINLPAGAVSTTTFTGSTGDEDNYLDRPLSLGGLLVAGPNTIAIEVHQADFGSSDAGIDLTLRSGSPATDGFSYRDDFFGTDNANRADGTLDAVGGFGGSAALNVEVGRGNFFEGGSKSGAWTQDFELATSGLVEISFRYRHVNSDGLDGGDTSEVILDIDGTRYGDAQNNSVSFIADGGDSGWQEETRTIALDAGLHRLALGIYNNQSRRDNEFANVWFDDVLVEFSGGASGVLDNDSGAAPLSAMLISTTSRGTLDFSEDGSFSYLPSADLFGADSFTYRTIDASGTSNLATVTINVAPVNDAPVVAADGYGTAEDVPLIVGAAVGVLANDSDIEGQSIFASLARGPERGSVSLNADGSFIYTPELNFFGTDSFTYSADDGVDSSIPTLVTVVISAADDPPVANPDRYEALENNPLVVTESGSGDIVFSTGFDTGEVAELSGGGAREGVAGFAGLGSQGNQFGGQFLRNATGVGGNGVQTATTLSLTGLPAHSSLSIEFLLAVIDTWDGLASNSAADYFAVQLDGVTVFRHYFHEDLSQQSYVAPAGGRLSTGGDLAGSDGGDSAYDMGLDAALRDIPHSSPTATISFFAGGGDWDGGNDESWAMDNLVVTVSESPRQPLLATGSTWAYLDDGSDLGTAWRAPGYDDSAWSSGVGKFGYGDGNESTTINFGPDDGNKFVTTYFRTAFDVADPGVFSNLLMEIQHDDAAAVYLNGSEIMRTNLAPAADAGEFATGTLPNEIETNFFSFSIDPAALVAGSNVLAVEVHQATPGSSDLGFDLSAAGVSSRTAGGVLSNDLEPDGQSLSASLVTDAVHGSVTMGSDGTFTYTPGLNFHGIDTFTYAASDGSTFTNGSVTIDVLPGPNDIPEPETDTYSGTEDQTLVVGAGDGVLRNDFDPDLDPLTALLHTQAEHGTVTLAPDGSFSYAPDADFAGSDTFRYVADDTIDLSAPTLVTLNIANVADRPLAVDDIFVAQPGALLTVPGPGVLGNDSDADFGSELSAVLISGPASGALNLMGDGGFTYAPVGGFIGSVTFTYRASDGGLQSPGAATVTIHVNRRPTAVADGYSVVEDNQLDVAAPGVLGNDGDSEGAVLTAVLVTEPSHGTLVLAANGSFNYVPDADYSGGDGFVYAASDGLQESANATVLINVSAVNDAPVANDDAYGVLAGATINIPAGEGVLNNDVDVDGTALTASLATTTANGELSFADDGSYTYTPAAGFAGRDEFSYVASDGALSSDPATVVINVGLAAEAILISEIMYHPASENNAEEFIEIFNSGDAVIDVGGWRFTSGINFTLPTAMIPPGGYLVVAADPTAFTDAYGEVPLLVGGWSGGLSNRGERLRLVDSVGNESDDFNYSDQGDWAQRQSFTNGGELGWEWFAAHDGGGSSLELINTGLTNKSGQNWAPSTGAPTPGAANSTSAPDIAPLISGLKHRPAVPRSTDPVTVTVKLKDVDESQLAATLFHRRSTGSPGGFTATTMFDDGLHGDGDAGDGEFGVVLAPDENGAIYEFYVEASDGVNTRTWPAPTDIGQNANALFQFDDEEFTGSYPIYRTIITQADENRFPFNNRQSDAELNATFIADNCGDVSVRYLSGLRIRGASSRNDTPPPTRVNVASDDPWDGETRLNLNTQFTWLQFIGMKFFQASGLPAPDTKRIAMRRNGADQSEPRQEGYGSIVHVQPLQEEFLDSHIPSDSGGNLYKKVRPDNDWAYREGDVGEYLGDGWNKQTNASEDDWTDLDEWLRVMNVASGAPDYIAQVEAVVDLDQWLQWFAIMTIIANGETNASNGTDDDYSIYRGIDDPRFIFIPHDLDTILGQGDGSSISNPESTIFDMIERGDSLDPLVPLFQDPGVLTRYYMALRQELLTTFSAGEFDALVDNHLTGWVPPDRIAEMKDFMNQRRSYITGLVDEQLGAPPAATPGTTDATLVALHGSLYISEVLASNAGAYQIGGRAPDAIEIHNSSGSAVDLAGMALTDDPESPARYVFPAGTSIPGGGYFVINSDTLGFGLSAEGDSIGLYDGGGVLVDSIRFGLQVADLSISRTGAGANTWALTAPTIGAANAVPQTLGSLDSLRINEWLVRPQITFERDFVELYNPVALPVALGGLVITDEPVAYPQRHSLPPLSFIAPSGFSLL
ncbi:MAG: tandem-95 repeat protein, partial [Verrucomicrobiales bacterium]